MKKIMSYSEILNDDLMNRSYQLDGLSYMLNYKKLTKSPITDDVIDDLIQTLDRTATDLRVMCALFEEDDKDSNIKKIIRFIRKL
jgi:hypothetical protein